MNTLKYPNLGRVYKPRLIYALIFSVGLLVSSCISLVPMYDAEVIELIEETDAIADKFYFMMEVDTSKESYRHYPNAEDVYYEMILNLRRINRMNDYRKKSDQSKQQIDALISVIENTRKTHKNRGEITSSGEITLQMRQVTDGIAAVRETEKRLPKQD